MKWAWYNENDAQKAAWLRELIRQNVIAPGEVDERSIVEVGPKDLRGFRQCHFFAGIGVWSYALRLAGWPDDRPVWTGSCPCGPFSVAGRNAAFADERHLWPYWFNVIEKSRPICIFGEQVENAIKHGWLDLVQDDMEAIAYAVGSVGLPAASQGAPHIRPRIYFVAYAESKRKRSGLCDCEQVTIRRVQPANGGELGYTNCVGKQAPMVGESPGETIPAETGQAPGTTSLLVRGWDEIEWINCRDGKRRPNKPGLCVLAHGAANRVLKLRGYGDAIVPQVAAEFIRCAEEAMTCGMGVGY